MVNSAAFRADQLNMSTEAMLRDIAFAGDAARIQLEQTYMVTQDLNQLYSRVSYLDERSTNIIRGIVYLIGLRWALTNNSADGATGSEVVNEVLSLERPFSFSEVVEPTATVSIQTEEIEPTVTRSLSTQTDHMSFGFDRIYELLLPYVAAYGAARVLWRLRSILPVVGDLIEEADSETTQHSPESSTLSGEGESTLSPDYATPHREMHSSEELSPDPDLSTPEITPQSIPTLSSGITPQSISPQSMDHILVCDNPTFQPSTPTSLSPDDTNPYQVHRHNFFRLRVGRHLPCFLQLLERLGL